MNVKGSDIWSVYVRFSFLVLVLEVFYFVCVTAQYKMIMRELWDFLFILMTMFSKARLPLLHSL